MLQLQARRFVAAILAFLLVLILSLRVEGEEATIAQTQQLFLKGRYAEALVAAAACKEAEPLASALLQHDLFLETGQREQARTALSVAAKLAPDANEVLRREAQWRLQARDFQRTSEILAPIANDPVAYWLQIECFLRMGKHAEARKALRWFAEQDFEQTADDVASVLALARGLNEHARWSRESKWFDVAVNEVLGTALAKHPNDWRIPALRARLFAEKHNEPAAVDSLNIALAKNASAVELHTLRAELALAKFDLNTAQRACEQATRINSQSQAAACIEADIAFAELRPDKAMEVLAAAQKLHGEQPEILGRLAVALGAMEGSQRRAVVTPSEQIRQQARASGAAGAQLCIAAGEACELMRNVELAKSYYQQAFTLAPELPGLAFHLAMQRLRLNENEGTRELLTTAFQEDPFDIRLKNTLAVLEVLQTYATLETQHFLIRFDRGRDELLAKYVADYLETEVYPELTQRFDYQPADKSVIELYSRSRNTSGHGWLSARMVGLPGLPTIGACSGRVVALASPTDLPRPFNWARVLRHEFVHRLNLEQTHFQVPHWVTEGLAVEAEERPRPSDWTRLLTRRYRENKLFTLADINFGFIRPATSEDRTLAYAQGELYIEFMRSRYTPASAAKLLQALAMNNTTSEAIRRATGVPLAEFEAGYRKYLEQQIAEWKLLEVVGSADADQLRDNFAKTPKNADLQAELAAAYLARGDLALAKRHAGEALGKNAKQQTAAWVLATLAQQSGDMAEAERLAQATLDIQRPHADLLLMLAERKLASKQYPLAEKLLLLGKKQFPSLDKGDELLVKLYAATHDSQKLRPVLEALAFRREDDATLPAKLMELAWQEQDFPATERWAMATLRIDVLHAAAHAYRGLALARQGRNGESLPEFAVAVKSDKMLPAWKLVYATVLLATENKAEARRMVEELIAQSPDLPGLVELAREVEK